MEGCRKPAKPGRVSFSRNPSLSYFMSKRNEAAGELGACDQYKGMSQLSKCYSPLEVPESPLRALEFLSRTWSSTSSDFFRIFSLNNLAATPEEQSPENRSGLLEEQERDKSETSFSDDTGTRIDQILTPLSSGKLADLSPTKHNAFSSSWMNIGQMKTWLGGDILSTLSTGCRKKRKEEIRLHAAQVHASLAVARLASAIAGIVANCTLEPIDPGSMGMNLVPGEWDKNMNTVVASAAALVATVCAEMAESVGANREIVASAIGTGLATGTCADMMALTATAATCLRGAAALELRAAKANMHVSEDQKILAKGAQLFIRMPEGRVHRRIVSIYAKGDKLVLRLGKKHIRGVITTNKEYRIFGAMKDSNGGGLSIDDHGFYLITLVTSVGTIQVLFEDQKQFRMWNSILSHLLCDCSDN